MSGSNGTIKDKRFNRLYFAKRYGTALFSLVLFAFFAITTDNFFSVNNLLTMLGQMSMLTIVSLGFTFVMAAGGFDMSLGNSSGLVNILFGLTLIQTGNLLVSILVGLATGLSVGLVNGVLVARLGLPDFIATYAVGSVAYGTKMLLTKGNPLTLPDTANPITFFIGQGRLGRIPFRVVLMVVAVLITIFILNKTRFGRRIYAIGGNKQASEYAGINVRKYRMFTFLLSGLFLAIASIILTSRLGSAQPLAGEDFMLDTIAAVYLSTTMFGEGEPTGAGTFIGALIITMLTNGLTMMSVEYYFQYITKGVVVILSVLTSVYLAGKMKKL